MADEMITRAATLLFEPGQILELRAFIPGQRSPEVSEFFTNLDEFVARVTQLEGEGRFKGIYAVLNPIKAKPSHGSTKDSDIARRRWLPIDLDAMRPDTNQPSTDAEHLAALEKAKEVGEFLTDMGWPQPVAADSGNGAHLLYPIDLPNDEESRILVEGCLHALAEMFSDDPVNIDTVVGKASRIWKVYGTTVRKGNSTPEPPWRLAKLIDVPDKLEIVSRGKLEALASLRKKNKAHEYFGIGERLDIPKWLADHNLTVAKTKRLEKGTLYVLEVCPWNPAHTDRSTYIIQWDSGSCFAACHHNHCEGKGWPELLAVYGEDDPTIPIQTVDLQSPVDSIGLAEDGTIAKVVEETIEDENGNKERIKKLVWVSDCALVASVETNADATEILLRGVGAVDVANLLRMQGSEARAARSEAIAAGDVETQQKGDDYGR